MKDKLIKKDSKNLELYERGFKDGYQKACEEFESKLLGLGKITKLFGVNLTEIVNKTDKKEDKKQDGTRRRKHK